MFDFFIIALLQFATLTGTPANPKIGGSGWDVDAVATPTTKIGGSGWDVDATSAPVNNIGGSGWDVD